ncbi:MAG: a-factor receptor [Trizodia sp. TS-e1964]|nr:MAG: a-factor receptor [Trizodia sp. TS-e1964]
MSLFLCVIILPLQFWILSTNVSIEWLPYDWSLIHSEDWWTIRMFPTGGVVPYDRWIAPGCSFFVFAFFGIGQDAVEMYRSWLLIMGFAKFFPSLKKPRMRKARKPSPTSSSSLGSRARHYFNIRKGSTSTYATDESFIRSRNDSVCATETMQSVCGPPTARLPAVSEDSENVYGLSSMEEKGWQGFSIPAIPAIRGAIHTPSRSIWANDEEAQVSSMRTSILGGKGGMDSREKGWVEGGKVLVKKEISQSSEDT